MTLAIGIIVLLLVAVFSAVFGILVAASIGIRRADSGEYHALREGGDDSRFSGAARRVSGLRFPGQDQSTDDEETDDSDNDGESSNAPKAMA